MVYIFLAHGFEEVEAVTPIDIIRRAEMDVRVVGIGGKEIKGAHGITVVCDIAEDEVSLSDLEMIVLPGGMPGTLNLEKSQALQEIIDHAVLNEKWVAAICAAPSILGHKGLLAGKNATCFPGFEDQLIGAVLSDERVCVDGRFVTAPGPGAAEEFSLKLVELLGGEQRMQKVKASMQCRK